MVQYLGMDNYGVQKANSGGAADGDNHDDNENDDYSNDGYSSAAASAGVGSLLPGYVTCSALWDNLVQAVQSGFGPAGTRPGCALQRRASSGSRRLSDGS
jgi:hypothetical protein